MSEPVPLDDAPEDYLPGSAAPKLSNSDVYEQLVASEGNVSHAAKQLGVSRTWLQNKIDRNVVLAAMMNDRREGIVDQAEQNVFADVLKNDPTANRFVLQTIGKHRGWASGVAGIGKGGEIVVQINKLAQPGEPTDGA
jgi:hypothetical protein